MTYKITEYFADTDETQDRVATAAEIADFEIREIKYAAIELAKNKKIEAKSALLEKLGITAEEAKLLIS